MSVHDFEATTIDGKRQSLGQYSGKTLLIVNVASQCGLTPQYEGLEALYRKHKANGLVVLGFPCNQFGAQEPGSESDIKEFCSTKYDVTFPLFSKIEVNGPSADPLYRYLRKEQPGPSREGEDHKDRGAIQWNFTKFLVDRRGNVVRRFEPNQTPHDIEREIEAQLRAS